MGLSREEAIVVGREVRGELLIEWARQLARSAKNDFEALSRRGLSKPMVSEFERLADQVARLETVQEQQKKAGKEATLTSHQAFEEALRWWREGKQMVKVEYGHDTDTMAEFRTGVKVGRSVPRLAREMEFMMGSFERRRAGLEWLGAADFMGRGKKILGRLKDVGAEQESMLKQLPRETAELYYHKGDLYALGRKIVRLARLVFMDEPAKAAPYSYDILRRGAVASKAAKSRAGTKGPEG